jgi:hypothetical protein
MTLESGKQGLSVPGLPRTLQIFLIYKVQHGLGRMRPMFFFSPSFSPQFCQVGGLRTVHKSNEPNLARVHFRILSGSGEYCEPKSRVKEDKRGAITFLQSESKIFLESYSFWILKIEFLLDQNQIFSPLPSKILFFLGLSHTTKKNIKKKNPCRMWEVVCFISKFTNLYEINV